MSPMGVELGGRVKNFINGEYVDLPADRETIDVTNPANGQVIAHLPVSTAADLDEAVQIAKAAQKVQCRGSISRGRPFFPSFCFDLRMVLIVYNGRDFMCCIKHHTCFL